MENTVKQICTAQDKARLEIDKYKSYVANKCTPSSDGLWDGDETVTLFRIDVENIMTTYFLYQALILHLQDELKHEFANLHPGLTSNGVCLNFGTWKDAIRLKERA
jgi:hypothetical protein